MNAQATIAGPRGAAASGQAADEPGDPGPSTSAEDEPPDPHGAKWGRGARPPGAAPVNNPARIELAVEAAALRNRRIDAAWLREHIARAAAHLFRPVERISVAVVDDARMSELHGAHRGSATTTDVLTFEHSASDEPLDVDIAVCADVAARQAAERGHGIRRELLLYILHGLLHCAGFDDRDRSRAAAMHEEEDRILEAIGVGRTFAGTQRRRDEGKH